MTSPTFVAGRFHTVTLLHHINLSPLRTLHAALSLLEPFWLPPGCSLRARMRCEHHAFHPGFSTARESRGSRLLSSLLPATQSQQMSGQVESGHPCGRHSHDVDCGISKWIGLCVFVFSVRWSLCFEAILCLDEAYSPDYFSVDYPLITGCHWQLAELYVQLPLHQDSAKARPTNA